MKKNRPSNHYGHPFHKQCNKKNFGNTWKTCKKQAWSLDVHIDVDIDVGIDVDVDTHIRAVESFPVWFMYREIL